MVKNVYISGLSYVNKNKNEVPFFYLRKDMSETKLQM